MNREPREVTKLMAQNIGWIKFWKPKDDWYYLESTERQVYLENFTDLVNRTLNKGAVLLGTYKCRGQADWARFELWEFPNLQAVVDFTDELEEIGHFQYFTEDNTVGRRYERKSDAASWAV